MRKLICLFLLALYSGHHMVAGQSISKIDMQLENEFRHGMLIGNVLIVEKGKVVYQRSFGMQDIEAGVPNKSTSEFALASVSKQFTSVAVLQLRERGKLQLDDPLVRYFPEFPFPAITVRHLLAQTSGLPEYELFDEAIEKQPGRVFGNGDVIPALKVWKKGLYFQPGDQWRYSSMNYCLLALLIEKVSGMKMQSYLEQYVLKPAGMRHTYLENYLIRTGIPERTRNYEFPTYYASKLANVDVIPDDHKMIYNLGGFYGQGGLTSTAEDLLLFDDAFFSGRLLKPIDIEEVLNPVTLNSGKEAEANSGFGGLGASGYGLGWFVLRDRSRGQIVWHDGSRPGISTVHLHNLKTNQTFIVLENTPNDGNGTAACAYQLWNDEPPVYPKLALIQVYGQTLVKDGPDAALAKLNFLRTDPIYKMPYDFIRLTLGYQLFAKKDYVPFSLEAFKTASLLFPDAWFISQGYGAALEKDGKVGAAILMYKKSVAQNPHADYAPQRLRALGSN